MTKADFSDWKANPITKQVFSQIRKRIVDLQEELGGTAGQSVLEDGKRVGAIQAYLDFLDIEYEASDD